MHTRRLAAIGLVLAATSLTAAAPASAVSPQRACPSPFGTYDDEALLVLAGDTLLDEQDLEGFVERTIAYFDKDGDGLVCADVHRLVPAKDEPTVNFIDNAASARAARP